MKKNLLLVFVVLSLLNNLLLPVLNLQFIQINTPRSLMAQTACNDSYEPNNTPAQAKALTMGNIHPMHKFCTANDEDWSYFDGIAGNLYGMETLHLASGVSTHLYLYGDNGNTFLAYDNAKGPENHSSRIYFTPTNNGRFYLKAVQSDGIGNVNYSYSIYIVNDTPATATPVTTQTPTATNTSTPFPTATLTPIPTATNTPTPLPTATLTPIPTATNTPTPLPTATLIPIPTATNTPTPLPTATFMPTSTPNSDRIVYDEGLAVGWGIGSSFVNGRVEDNPNNTSIAHTGSKSIAAIYHVNAEEAGLLIRSPEYYGVDISPYSGIEFWTYGTGIDSQFTFFTQDALGGYRTTINVPAGVWKKHSITWSQLESQLGNPTKVAILAWYYLGSTLPYTLYIDDIRFIGQNNNSISTPTPTPTTTPLLVTNTATATPSVTSVPPPLSPTPTVLPPAQQNKAVLSIVSPMNTIQVNVPVTLSITISNITSTGGMGGFEFVLGFDPSKINIQDITMASFLGSTGRSEFPLAVNINNIAGTAGFAATTFGGSSQPGPIGSGVIAYVRLVPLISGTHTLSLNSGVVANIAGDNIPTALISCNLDATNCPWDVDNNGRIDVLDVQKVAYRWNTQIGNPLYEARYDIDGNGQINILDVQKVAYRWNTLCSANVIMQLTTSLSDDIKEITPPQIRLIQSNKDINNIWKLVIYGHGLNNVGAFQLKLSNLNEMHIVGIEKGSLLQTSNRQFVLLEPIKEPQFDTLTLGAYSLGESDRGIAGDGELMILTIRQDHFAPKEDANLKLISTWIVNPLGELMTNILDR